MYNVERASGICVALNILPNKCIHQVFVAETKKMEANKPRICKTANGKCRALDRANLAKVKNNTMKKLKADSSKLELFRKHCSYLRFTANTNNSTSICQSFVKRALKSLNQPLITNFKSLNQLDVDPTTSTIATVRNTKKKRGRRVSDVGNDWKIFKIKVNAVRDDY